MIVRDVFEVVEKVVCLGTLVICENGDSLQENRRIAIANCAIYELCNQVRFHNKQKQTKSALNKSLIFLPYARET